MDVLLSWSVQLTITFILEIADQPTKVVAVDLGAAETTLKSLSILAGADLVVRLPFYQHGGAIHTVCFRNGEVGEQYLP